jgi:hypothetical protein
MMVQKKAANIVKSRCYLEFATKKIPPSPMAVRIGLSVKVPS